MRNILLPCVAFLVACGGGGVALSANMSAGSSAPPTTAAPPPPPAPVDSDNDGVANNDDKCPDKPGTKENGGCPVEEVKLEGSHLAIAHKIMFNPNEFALTADDGPILDAIATFLKSDAGKTVELIEIAGHADHQGDEGANTKLTSNRAKSVMDGLVQRGVDAKRLNAVGYGEYCPIEKADTPEAKEKNRRVEFQVLKIGGKPTGATLGCDAALKKGIKPTVVK